MEVPVVSDGPKECKEDGQKIACTDKKGAAWSNAGQCYFQLSPDQPAPPPGQSASMGAWYDCARWCADGLTYCSIDKSWRASPPPGVTRMTPAQAAATLLARFVFQPVPIGIAPKPDPGFKGSVGLPVWMWVQNTNQHNFGPWTQSASIGGIAITGTAKVVSVTWDMGDGTTVTCNGKGTPFDVSYGAVPSPDCGHIYSRMSKDKPGRKYQVTAIANWQFDWTAAGQTGSANTTVQSQTQIEIGEMQTVITHG